MIRAQAYAPYRAFWYAKAQSEAAFDRPAKNLVDLWLTRKDD
jgi:hypothetical protein